MKSFVVLSSGRGSGFEAMVKAQRDGVVNAKLLGLVCNVADAPVLERAKRLEVDSLLIESKGLRRDEHDARVLTEIKQRWGMPDYLVLSGYFRVLSSALIDAFKDERGFSRIINIHPSLLPAFTGLHSYQQAFDYGCKVAGCTVHLVEEQVDSGPILAQESFSIAGFKEASLVEARGLGIEHRLYAETVKWFFEDRFTVENRNGRVCVLPT